MVYKKTSRWWVVVNLLLITGAMQAERGETSYTIETNVLAGGGNNTPFYLANLRQGMVSLTPNNGYLSVEIARQADSAKKWSYGYSIEGYTSYSTPTPFYLQQAYIDGVYRGVWQLSIGSKEEYSLLQTADLSSGSVVWSGNAHPIPQLRIGIPSYCVVPYTNGWLHIKGEVAYGCYVDNIYQEETHTDNNNYSQDVLYHRKYLQLKAAHPSSVVYGSLGIDMAAQFGATVYKDDTVYSYPHKLEEFFKVLVPLEGGNDSPTYDQVNITGNQVGSYLFELGYYHSAAWQMRGYYEHLFDDHSGMAFANGADGVWGIEYSNSLFKGVEGVVLEYVVTTNQSGPFLWDATDEIPIQVSHGDNYYQHLISGWAHAGYTQGTPFISSPSYRSDGSLKFFNSRSRAYHGAIKGRLTAEWCYRIMASYQTGWGTYYEPFAAPRHSFSWLVEGSYSPSKWREWQGILSLAGDRGTLLGNNFAVQINVRRVGNIAMWKRR